MGCQSSEPRRGDERGTSEVPRVTVAHLVTPYLFPTGSWIHHQIAHARRTRPVVLTHALEHPERFPVREIHLLPALLHPWERPLARLLWAWGRYAPWPYRRLAARARLDVAHAHMGWEAARAAPAVKSLGLPLVVSFYGSDVSALPRRWYWRRLYRRLFRLADRYVVEGPHLGRSLAALGCPAERIRVIHLGVDLDRIPERPQEPPSPPLRLLMSCRLTEKKGVAYALRALARCRELPEWELEILGDGPLRAQLERLAGDLGIAPRVRFRGSVPYETHLEALRRAHLFLAPSVTAADGDAEGGAPVSLIEAHAAGVPAVASRHCDIPEVVRDGTTGLLVPERDTDALAGAIQRLARDAGLRRRMGQAARRHVEAAFDVRRQVARLEDLYLELVGIRGSA
jgi:colanic acid/amylovoran biosynthesis glycosyltransferase